jgi:uncharacterized OB-fold protein
MAATAPCQAPSANWNGTWKMDPSKGNFQGPIFTISVSADGEYRYEGGSSAFTFRCDGEDRAIGNNRTRACEKIGTTVLDLTRKENGVKTNVSHWELSADGNVLTATAMKFRPSGPPVKTRMIASRISGTNGFVGQWRDTSDFQRHAEMTVSVDSQTLRIGYPAADQYIDAPLNGAPCALHGPNIPEGMTCTARLLGQRDIRLFLGRSNGTRSEESLHLSNDGKVISYFWWNPESPDNRGMSIYEKQ